MTEETFSDTFKGYCARLRKVQPKIFLLDTEIRRIHNDTEEKQRIIENESLEKLKGPEQLLRKLNDEYWRVRQTALKQLASDRIIWKQQEVKRLCQKLVPKTSKWNERSTLAEKTALIRRPTNALDLRSGDSDDEGVLNGKIYNTSSPEQLFSQWEIGDELLELLQDPETFTEKEKHEKLKRRWYLNYTKRSRYYVRENGISSEEEEEEEEPPVKRLVLIDDSEEEKHVN